MGFENVESEPTFEQKVESVIKEAKTLDDLVEIFEAWALLIPTITDPKTGNKLETKRIATAIKSRSHSVRADECPIYINSALEIKGDGFEAINL